MKEKPIIFNGEMVRAILSGKKTQTRRPIVPQPKIIHAMHSDGSLTTERIFRRGDQRIHPPYSVGDRLYVRETWNSFFEDEVSKERARGPLAGLGIPASPERKAYIYYAADGELKHPIFGMARWCPSIHMPKSAARIWLVVTDVSVQQLSLISEEEARKEGFNSKDEFVAAWISIYGEESYTDTTLVWVIDFMQISR